jgi:hypothetical protein
MPHVSPSHGFGSLPLPGGEQWLVDDVLARRYSNPANIDRVQLRAPLTFQKGQGSFGGVGSKFAQTNGCKRG